MRTGWWRPAARCLSSGAGASAPRVSAVSLLSHVACGWASVHAHWHASVESETARVSRCIACDLWGGAAGYLNDLHVLEPLSNMWSDLSGTARGIAPLARSGVGMEAIADRLYVYGGQGPGAVGGRLGGVMGCVGCADLCMRLVRGVRKDLCGCWGAMRCARASAARLHPGPGCAP
eukprot:3043130-Rhodomonas_salina.1